MGMSPLGWVAVPGTVPPPFSLVEAIRDLAGAGNLRAAGVRVFGGELKNIFAGHATVAGGFNHCGGSSIC